MERIVGIDLARRSAHQAVILNGSEVQHALPVRPVKADLDGLVALAGGPGAKVVMEPTALSWVAVEAWLAYRGCEVMRSDTKKAHDFRKVISRDSKTDRIDAEGLARMVLAAPNAVHASPQLTRENFALQRLVRMRAALVDDRRRTHNRILACVECLSPEYAAALGRGRTALRGDKLLLLREHLHPQGVVELGVQGLGQRISDGSLAERWVDAAENAWAIWGELEAHGCCPVDFDITQLEVDLALDRVDLLNKQISKVEDKIRIVARNSGAATAVRSIPGIGPIVSAAIAGLIGDVRRFPNVKAFVRYLGLSPRKNLTGGKDRGGQVLSKAGNRLLRQYLFLSATAARRVDPEMAALYQRHIDRGRHHNDATTILAHKLARNMYAVLRRQVVNELTTYQRRDLQGRPIEPEEAVQLVREQFPSKAEKRKRTAPQVQQIGTVQVLHQCTGARSRPHNQVTGPNKSRKSS